MKLNILAIVAHPADSFDMIGGTLANHIEAGHAVTVAITDSDNTLHLAELADTMRRRESSKRLEDEAIAGRRESVFSACRLLGIEDVRFLTFPGEWLTRDVETVSRTADLIQNLKPHIIITHNPQEDAGTMDHGICGQIVMEAMHLSKGARKGGKSPHFVGQVYFMCWAGVDTWLDSVSAHRYGSIRIDVSNQVEKKVRAYAQLSGCGMDLKRSAKLIECICGTPGIHTRVAYVESFQPYRPEVYRTLPISDHNLWLTQATTIQGVERLELLAPFVDDPERNR